MLRFIPVILAVLILSAPRIHAQEVVPAEDSFSDKLGQSLYNLRNSVEELSSGNEVLAVKNTQLRSELNQLQTALQKVIDENRQLSKASDKLAESNPSRAAQVEHLQAGLVDLNNKIKECTDQIKAANDAMAAKQKEAADIDHKTEELKNKPVDSPKEPVVDPMADSARQKQKQKLALLKMIMKSQNQQDLLRAQIQDFQKDVPGVPKLKEKETLNSQIKYLQEDITQLRANQSTSRVVWTQEQISRLQESISDLEKNRDELQNLVAQMKQKNQRLPVTQTQRNEQFKIQTNIEKLKNETRGLQFDLQELQQEMITLDKRKAYLETLLQK